MNIKKYIGSKIKEHRKKLELTQNDLAENLSLSRTSILNIEAGRHSPTISMLWSICNLLNCTPNDLMPKTIPVEWGLEEEIIKVYKKKIKVKADSSTTVGVHKQKLK